MICLQLLRSIKLTFDIKMGCIDMFGIISKRKVYKALYEEKDILIGLIRQSRSWTDLTSEDMIRFQVECEARIRLLERLERKILGSNWRDIVCTKIKR